MAVRPLLGILLSAPALFLAVALAPAQVAAPQIHEACPGLVAADAPRIVPAALRLAELSPDQVRLTYVGHSSFLIESARQVRIATDYNDYVRLPVLPDIVTMNHAHDTHFTHFPDPAIKHVLRGWTESGAPARHDLRVEDVRVRNVPTNIRMWDGGTERHGNSIFVFEIGGLCIAHLGHLHHTLNKQQLGEIGRPDVVLVPVDGSFTLDLEGMMEVLQALNAPLMIPMHYFSDFTLQRFLDRAGRTWTIERAEVPSVLLSKATLPTAPKVLVLPGR
ncbi:MAG: MBL fold metallo-hydrolase [Xanthobacteraceae bacterium]